MVFLLVCNRRLARRESWVEGLVDADRRGSPGERRL